jgi:hypothetical protein
MLALSMLSGLHTVAIHLASVWGTVVDSISHFGMHSMTVWGVTLDG